MRRSVIRRKLGRVDRAIDKAIARAELPGAVVLARVPREGELLEHVSVRGLAVVRPERIPMTRETVFDLASLTKPIATATAILLLVDEGAVGLDDPVSKFLPVFSERDKDGVTLRHLLTHSSGLKPWRAYHELLIEKERKTGERTIGTPAAREFAIERTLRSGLCTSPGKRPSTETWTSSCWAPWWRPWPARRSTTSAASGSSRRSGCATAAS